MTRHHITDEQMSSIEWFHLQEDTEELRNILRAVGKEIADEPTKTREEIQTRLSIFRETLAGIYGKDMPYEEERLGAKIDEDEWFLNLKTKVPP